MIPSKLIQTLKRLPARFYRSDSGREPVREWPKSLDAGSRKVIGEDIKDVEFSWPIACLWFGSGGRPLGGSEQLPRKPDRSGGILRDSK